jgi:hypothetical protein
LSRREPSNRRLLLVHYAFTYCRLLTAEEKVTGGQAKSISNAAPRGPFLTRGVGRIRPAPKAGVSNLDWPVDLWTGRWTLESDPVSRGRKGKGVPPEHP